MSSRITIAVSVGMILLGGPARAAVITGSLNETQVVGFPSAPFGTVTVTDLTGGGVSVDVSLQNSFSFVITGNKSSFALNLDTAISSNQIQNISPAGKYTVNLSAQPATPYGDFNVALDVAGGNGGANAVPPPLDFTILGVTTLDFNFNTSGYAFAADVISSGKTGSVGAKNFVRSGSVPISQVASVPEPGSFELFVASLALTGLFIRKNRSRHRNVGVV